MVTVLDLSPIAHLSREQFYQLCMANRDVPLERSPQGELIIVPPVGGESGSQEAGLIAEVVVWSSWNSSCRRLRGRSMAIQLGFCRRNILRT